MTPLIHSMSALTIRYSIFFSSFLFFYSTRTLSWWLGIICIYRRLKKRIKNIWNIFWLVLILYNIYLTLLLNTFKNQLLHFLMRIGPTLLYFDSFYAIIYDFKCLNVFWIRCFEYLLITRHILFSWSQLFFVICIKSWCHIGHHRKPRTKYKLQ